MLGLSRLSLVKFSHWDFDSFKTNVDQTLQKW